MGEKSKGTLVIIGGAEDKSGECRILKHSVEIIGGSNAKLTILTTATENPESVGNNYRQVFNELGVNNIDILKVNN